jgi:uncharacterized repeat protein (TIGR03803 family)
MTSPHLASIVKTSFRWASIALAFAVVVGLEGAMGQSAEAQTLSVLHKFTGSPDGQWSFAGLVRDAAGNLYGTTEYGGSSNLGTVFKVDTAGTVTVLHSFAGGRMDGKYPIAGVVRDKAGNLYGTTVYGGSSENGGWGWGTVFEIDTTGKETVLHKFAGGTRDGCNPYGGLLLYKGNLYGTTNSCGASGYGTVFKLVKKAETQLYSFAGGPGDGAGPYFTSLLMDANQTLYGVTFNGGGPQCNNGCGTVFKLDKAGKETVLHSFTGTPDGCYPNGTLVNDRQGNLYGISGTCGSFSQGIVWKLSSNGNETVLHSFAGGSSDGAYPVAGVILDAQGNLYGDTEEGGASSLGTVYRLNRKGQLSLLHTFTGSDGKFPIGSLIRDDKGDFYGTTYEGGTSGCDAHVGCGTVWKLTP